MSHIRTAYLDASVLVKLLVFEPGADRLQSFLGRAVRATTWLCVGETLGVLKLKWLRGLITQEQYLAACEGLIAEVRNETLDVEDIGINSRDVFDAVEALAKKHGIDISDALQLLTLKQGLYSRLEGESRAVLVTADKALADAAVAEGLPAWECMHDPLP